MNINNLAIDFGTCNTVISYMHNGNISHILNDINGDLLIPSSILFIKEEISSKNKITELIYNKHFIIGHVANEKYNSNKDHESFFYQFKRFLGLTSKSLNSRDFLEKFKIKYELDDEIIYFYIPTNDDEYIKINIIELIRCYFIGLNNLIKHNLNLIGDITIILTCPAYFHDLQRSQLKKAAEESQFKIFKIYNEPTAAAIYYINKLNDDNYNNKFIVYDLGGGTIDTTVVEYHLDTKTCEIIDIAGNNSLGGIDIDNLIIEDIYQKYCINNSKANIKWLSKIRKYAEEIKIKLSYTNSYEIVLENVPINKNNTIIIEDILRIKYTKHMFNSLINNLIDKMIESIIWMHNLYKTTNIIFIGGPTQIPLLQEKLTAVINLDSNKIILNNKNYLYKTIVADGAATLYDMLNTKVDFCLLDIIPMNIGISSINNEMIIMINKNSKIPTTVERIFTTSYDCQRSINIEIYEGNSNLYLENTFIGSYMIIGIPPLQRGGIIIKLLFKITYNGILNISINGFKNPSDISAKSFDFKLTEKIKLIPNIIAKELLRKILSEKK